MRHEPSVETNKTLKTVLLWADEYREIGIRFGKKFKRLTYLHWDIWGLANSVFL